MADFSVDINKWCEAAEANAKLFVVAYAVNLQRYIQSRTPVLTGRLRASIQPTKPLIDWQPGDDITIATNVEYARRIEYGFTGKDSLGRHYHQKGVGMFTQAAAAADEIAEMTLTSITGKDLGPGGEDVFESLLDAALEGIGDVA